MNSCIYEGRVRHRRRGRVRGKISKRSRGRVRLSVFRSGRHIYAQVIDDRSGNTIGIGDPVQIVPLQPSQ